MSGEREDGLPYIGQNFHFVEGTPCTAGGCTGKTFVKYGWHADRHPLAKGPWRRIWACTGGHWCNQWFKP